MKCVNRMQHESLKDQWKHVPSNELTAIHSSICTWITWLSLLFYFHRFSFQFLFFSSLLICISTSLCMCTLFLVNRYFFLFLPRDPTIYLTNVYIVFSLFYREWDAPIILFMMLYRWRYSVTFFFPLTSTWVSRCICLKNEEEKYIPSGKW